MPYIAADERPQIDASLEPLLNIEIGSAGRLNYIITRIIRKYLAEMGIRYLSLNEVIGVLECVKFELNRRVLVDYEDKKIAEHGDVF